MAATTRSSSKAANKKQGVSSQSAKVTKKVATTSKGSGASAAGKKKATTATAGKKQKKEVKEQEEEQPAADEEFDSTDNESSSDEEDTYLKGFDDEEQDVEAAEKEGEYDAKSGISKNAATAKQQKEQLDNAKAKVAEVTQSKKASDASSDDVNNGNTKKVRGVLYIGRIPHGFYESQMRAYFGQFGDILHLRLSRNKKTGASKHYAFIEFTDADVARVVSETMDNYLLFGHILKVKLIPTEEVRDDLFVGADRKFTVVDWQGINQQKANEPKTRKTWNEIQERAKERREKAAERVKSLGIDYVYQSATATPKKEAAAASKVTKSKATKKKTTKKSA